MYSNSKSAVTRRSVLRATVGASIATAVGPAMAQTYPSRPIHLIVGFPPGSSSDSMARMLAKPLGDILNTVVVVEQKSGASGATAAAQVAHSPKDGYTLLYGLQDSQILVPLLKRNAPYKPDVDFTPIAQVVSLNLVLVARSSLNVTTVQQLLSKAREVPSGLRFSSSGIGGVHHLTMEMLMQKTGTLFQHIPYQGGGPALMGLLRGDVDVMVGSEALVKPHVAGKLVALATTGKERSTQLKDVPTMLEVGVPLMMTAWYGLFAPVGLPEAVVARLADAARAAVATPEYQQQIRSVGAEAAFLGRGDFASSLQTEMRNYKEVVDLAGIKIQDY